MQINSLNLEVNFDFQECKCSITDKGRNITDEYFCHTPFLGKCTSVASMSDFNRFVGESVHAFLDDNEYSVYEDVYE